MTDLATIVKTDDDVYKTLLESTKAIPWKIDWATMQFAYIGPQIESLLGWSPQSWATVDDWAARMHEDDRERVVNFCVTQSKGGMMEFIDAVDRQLYQAKQQGRDRIAVGA